MEYKQILNRIFMIKAIPKRNCLSFKIKSKSTTSSTLLKACKVYLNTHPKKQQQSIKQQEHQLDRGNPPLIKRSISFHPCLSRNTGKNTIRSSHNTTMHKQQQQFVFKKESVSSQKMKQNRMVSRASVISRIYRNRKQKNLGKHIKSNKLNYHRVNTQNSQANEPEKDLRSTGQTDQKYIKPVIKEQTQQYPLNTHPPHKIPSNSLTNTLQSQSKTHKRILQCKIIKCPNIPFPIQVLKNKIKKPLLRCSESSHKNNTPSQSRAQNRNISEFPDEKSGQFSILNDHKQELTLDKIDISEIAIKQPTHTSLESQCLLMI